MPLSDWCCLDFAEHPEVWEFLFKKKNTVFLLNFYISNFGSYFKLDIHLSWHEETLYPPVSSGCRCVLLWNSLQLTVNTSNENCFWKEQGFDDEAGLNSGQSLLIRFSVGLQKLTLHCGCSFWNSAFTLRLATWFVFEHNIMVITSWPTGKVFVN